MKEYYLKKGIKVLVTLLFGAIHRENHAAVSNFLGMPEIHHQVHWAQTLTLRLKCGGKERNTKEIEI